MKHALVFLSVFTVLAFTVGFASSSFSSSHGPLSALSDFLPHYQVHQLVGSLATTTAQLPPSCTAAFEQLQGQKKNKQTSSVDEQYHTAVFWRCLTDLALSDEGEESVPAAVRRTIKTVRAAQADMKKTNPKAIAPALIRSVTKSIQDLFTAVKRSQLATQILPKIGEIFGDRFFEVLTSESKLLPLVRAYLQRELAAARRSNDDAPLPYWRFLPTFGEAVKPSLLSDSSTFNRTKFLQSSNAKDAMAHAVEAGIQKESFGKFSSNCFDKVEMFATKDSKHSEVEVFITATGQTSVGCVEILALSAFGQFKLDVMLWDQLVHGVKIKFKGKEADITARQYLVDQRGIQVFKQAHGLIDDLVSGLETVAWYLPSMIGANPELSPTTEMLSALMMNDYLPLNPQFKALNDINSSNSNLPPAFPTTLRSGDLIIATRLDGIDSFFNWWRGGTAAHLAIVLCSNNSSSNCEICESRAQAQYWSYANGVQCRDAAGWLKAANDASFLATHVPLSAGVTFDAAGAKGFAKKYNLVDFGYANFFYGWNDVPGMNLPCLPEGNFTAQCLVPEHFEQTLCFISDVLAGFGNFFGGQGLVNRVWPTTAPPSSSQKTSAATVGDYHPPHNVIGALYAGLKDHGWTYSDMIVMPELDTYEYISMQNGMIYHGPIFTSSAFACFLLRAGGAFNDTNTTASSFQCQEMINWDVISLDLFDVSKAKQFLGDYSYPLTPARTPAGGRKPYNNMFEKCPTKGPFYTRPDDC